LNAAALRNLLLRLLELSREGPVGLDDLRSAARITRESLDEALDGLEREGLVTLREEKVDPSLRQRLGIAVRALEAGADFEGVSRSLGWLEFEEMAALVFEENGFRVHRRFRFRAEGRRWEVDVLASRRPHIFCAECKHWSRGMGDSTARKMIEAHLEKTGVFSRSLPGLAERVGVGGWARARVTPMALSLTPTPKKLYRRVPAVSVLALPSFLGEFEGQMGRIAHFDVELPPLKAEPRQTSLRLRWME